MAYGKIEQPSRQRIIHCLKRADWMSVAELSRKLGITTMAVRQHLLALDKQGIVHNSLKKTGVGRPVCLYALTEKAENIFPKAYGRFISEVFNAVEKIDGADKIDAIFRKRKEKILQDRISVLSEVDGLRNKVHTMAEILNQNGYMAEFDEMDDCFSLKQFNCPISEVSHKYKSACKYQLELYRDLFGDGVQRTECMSEGNTSCTYIIPG